jgi:hypothetical protein
MVCFHKTFGKQTFIFRLKRNYVPLLHKLKQNGASRASKEDPVLLTVRPLNNDTIDHWYCHHVLTGSLINNNINVLSVQL